MEEWDNYVKERQSGESEQKHAQQEKEIEAMSTKLSEVGKTLATLEESLQEDNQKTVRLTEIVNKKQTFLTKIKLQHSEITQLAERIQESKERHSTVGDALSDLQLQRPKLQSELETLRTEFNQAKREFDSTEEATLPCTDLQR